MSQLYLEGVYVTIGNPAFYLLLYLIDVHFRGEIDGVTLSDVLYNKMTVKNTFVIDDLDFHF